MPQLHPGVQPGKPLPQMKLSSRGFADGATMPRRFTADGENVSPPLSWGEPPRGTESFALICEDPDAPSGSFVHWLVWGLPAELRELREGAAAQAQHLSQGTNGFGHTGWGGPSPPPGRPHRYVFRLRALDCRPRLAAGVKRAELERVIEGHVLGEAVLVGRYGRL